MALLAARSLESLKQEARSFLSNEQIERLTSRLNQSDQSAISAEWELIVLTALSYEGNVEHEPALAGSSKLDFRLVQPASGIDLVGDITAVSDGETQKNSTDFLVRELSRRLEKQGIPGEKKIVIDAHSEADRRPFLPDPHQFRCYIFNRKFIDFEKQIAAHPVAEHILRIDNEKAKLTIKFIPGHNTTILAYREHKLPDDITHNVVWNALHSKHSQIKKSEHLHESGWRCVVLCDGGCAVLGAPPHCGGYTARDVIMQYLKQHHSLDAVIWISIAQYSECDGRLSFCVEAEDWEHGGLSNCIKKIFTSGLSRIPRPVRTASNAKYYLDRQSRHGIPFTDYANSSFRSLDEVEEFEFSSRALFDFIAGRIDRSSFEIAVKPHMIEALKRRLESGALPTKVRLLRSEAKDDDILQIEVGTPDPAVPPRLRGAYEAFVRKRH